ASTVRSMCFRSGLMASLVARAETQTLEAGSKASGIKTIHSQEQSMNKPTNTHSLDTNKERKRLLSYSIVIGMIIVAVTIFGGSRLFPFEKNSSRVESSPADYSKIVKSMEGLG